MRNRYKTIVFQMLTLLALISVGATNPVLAADPDTNDDTILELSLEDLLDIEVTSVSKRAQPMQDAAAAVFVLTSDDIDRLGVTNLPDALRQVPGIHVGRIDSNKWAVTSRGFNGRFSNKLLVLVDGRSVYTTSFSGVYWEVQDLMIEDIDRIEIIRGPGSTLWGANAVNGVINIITKHTADTEGGVVVAGAGDLEQGFAGARWGQHISGGTYARAYAKAHSRGQFADAAGQDAGDDWRIYRGGFRLDSQLQSADARTLQGDIYQGTIRQRAIFAQLTPPYSVTNDEDVSVKGGNLLGRWSHTISPTSGFSAQVYFDRAIRDEALAYQATSQLDYDFQHNFAAQNHQIVWGLGYRYSSNDLRQRVAYLLADETRALTLYSAFIQDEISLWHDKLDLTIGSKFEHNDYTGAEYQPSARILWRVHNAHRLWAGVSRAVRTPMRAEDEMEILLEVVPPDTPWNPAPIPAGAMVTGTEDIRSEVLVAYEVGYRFTRPAVSADIAAFYNEYSDLTNLSLGELDVRYLSNPPYIAQPLWFDNADKAADYGVELALAWRPHTWLRWNLAYSFLKNDTSQTDDLPPPDLGSPEHMVSLNAGLNPTDAVNLNLNWRYVDDCQARDGSLSGNTSIPSYTTLDLRLGLQLRDEIEFSLVGQDLLTQNHLEYTPESFTLPTEVPRSFYAKIKWTF